MSIKQLTHDLQHRRISRRTFMQQATAMGITLAGASSMANSAMAATPKPGGRLTVGFAQGSSSDSLDPATYANDFMFSLGYAVFNNLTEIAPDGSVQAELAEHYEASPDARIWTFNLRRDVAFSNGQPLTSADVLATLKHHTSEQSTSGVKPLLAQIIDMQAPDAHTLVFTLAGGNADFPFVFADYHLGIRPAVKGKIDPATRIGSGGYSLEEFEPGVRAVLKRREGYWKAGRAHLSTVELNTIADPAARMSALMTGEVDLIDRPDLKAIHMLKRVPGVKIHTANGTLHYTMPMMVNAAPFDDANVRQALKYAIDRESLVSKVLKGYGRVGNDHPIASSMPFYASELPQRQYDPEKAKHYLRKAGLSSLDVQIHTSDAAFSGAVDASILFSESARQANINLKVVREPNDGYWSNVWMNKAFCTSYWGGRPTPDLMFSAGYAADAAWNATRWQNPQFNKLLTDARAELDQQKRAAMYAEMQRLCRDDGGALIPMFGQYVSAMSDRVQMPEQISEMWDLDCLRFIERWWVA
ncbi:peptide ABC transporter substrate-binding protein [Bacterioplanes sanyensis]|uniref:Peptide ABC transporter substrate-binding protein n=1 Tax=Bacterioplanes sanyensis TaxID=1249553 RepID=A0A222FFW9_9GAMM|nr:ABC transporter substrate-binding protein [Bacterioplanes sanyensis]ASP37311.1 peptide ABC transporter substrate-binding protein [Bacterioplanes sanyensis]